MEKQDWGTMQTRKVKALNPNKAVPVKKTKEEEEVERKRAQAKHDGVVLPEDDDPAATMTTGARLKAVRAAKQEKGRAAKKARLSV